MTKKVLFVHDGPMMSNASKTIFYGVHYTDGIVERYSFFGDSVSFLMRNKKISDIEGLQFTPLTHPAFKFIEVPNFKSILSKFRQKQAENIIEQAVIDHDILIVRLPSANGVIAKNIAEKLGKPVLVEVVACVFDALWNYDWRGKLLAHYKMNKYREHIRTASHVVYVTEEFLQKRYPTDGKSIGCSDVELRNIDESILQKRVQKIGNSTGSVVLGTVAAIDVPYKGQADVIKALYRLKQQGITNFEYKIVGQGNPERLMTLVNKIGLNDQVEILGSLPHEEVFDFVDSLDLYIQPSKQEGLPRAVVEAMSRACPVLASNIAGLPELIQKEALFQAGNVQQIEVFLRNFINKPLKEFALSNFQKSKSFLPKELHDRRIGFYKEFFNDSVMKKSF